MSKTLVMVGTRKGCFLLESDERRLEWEVRGPFCEGWPIYHVVRDADSGAIYAAGASEWHGASVWRSLDLGETWTQSSEGPRVRRLRAEALEGLGPHRRPRTPLRRRGDAGHLREPRRGQDVAGAEHARRPARPGVVERSGEPAAGPPRRPRDPAAPRRSEPLLGDRPGDRHLRDDGRRQLLDAAEPRVARGLADRESRGGLLRPQARDVAARQRPALPAEPRRDASQRRRRTVVDGDHGGAADGVRLRGGGASAGPRHVLRDPARPGPRALHARRERGGLAHRATRARRGSGSTTAFPSATPTSASSARG